MTCQFNTKVFSRDASKPHLWCSNPLQNVEFGEDKTGFYADDCAGFLRRLHDLTRDEFTIHLDMNTHDLKYLTQTVARRVQQAAASS